MRIEPVPPVIARSAATKQTPWRLLRRCAPRNDRGCEFALPCAPEHPEQHRWRSGFRRTSAHCSMRRSMPRMPSAPIRRKASRWSCCSRPIPRARRPHCAAGEIDVMWGGPLRVTLTHAPIPAADSVCFCDVIARDPFFVIGREPRPNFRVADLSGLRFASVAEVPTPVAVPAGRSAPRRRRSCGVEPHQRPEHGGERRLAARRRARRRAGLPALRRGVDRIGQRTSLVCGGGPRPHRVHHAGDAPAVAGIAPR